MEIKVNKNSQSQAGVMIRCGPLDEHQHENVLGSAPRHASCQGEVDTTGITDTYVDNQSIRRARAPPLKDTLRLWQLPTSKAGDPRHGEEHRHDKKSRQQGQPANRRVQQQPQRPTQEPRRRAPKPRPWGPPPREPVTSGSAKAAAAQGKHAPDMALARQHTLQ